MGNLKDIVPRLKSYIRLKSSITRAKRSNRKGEASLSYPPTSLNLLMVDKCNAGCIMCGHDYKNCGTSAAITLEKVKVIYEKLDMNQLVEVVYGGGGEPFLNPDLADIAEYTRKVCPAVQHTVISNMIARCRQEDIDKMMRSRVHFLVSVNAASQETFREVSGVDAFSTVCDNLSTLVASRKRLGCKVGISISIILMRQNVDELPEFIRLAKKLGVDGVKVVYVRIYPERYRTKSDGSIFIQPSDSLYYHQKKSNTRIEEAGRLAKELGVSFEHQPSFGCSSAKQRDCLEPYRSLYIGFNGELYPCAASEILFMHKVASGCYQSGNILTQSIEDIWNNPFWQALRKTNCQKGREELVPECLCCGSSINWWGVDEKSGHIMDWDDAEKSDFRA